MKKILGLDLGVSTIGWSLIQESHETFEILGMGTRIVPYNLNNLNNGTELSEFQKGKSYTTNQNRREKRGARVNASRYQLRKYQLRKVLENLQMLPNENLFALSATELYGLRKKALTEQLSLEEIGRIFFHLNQKRGYKSSRKTGQNDKSDYLKNIKVLELQLIENQQTIGEFFYENLVNDLHFQVKKKIFNRETYIAEFDKIWDAQAVFYPNILTDENRIIIRDEIIYYQRALKSQKGNVSHCPFHPKLKAAPKSSPLFQIAKIWQAVNSLAFEDSLLNKTPLTLEQKQILVDELNRTDKLSEAKIKKLLKVSADLSLNIKDLQGNLTRTKLQKILSNRPNLLIFDSVGELDEQPLFRLWHLLYSVDDENTVIKKLQEEPYLLDEQQAIALSEITFQQGYGSLSSKALKAILPHLEQGFVYSVACEKAGYDHSNSETTEQREARELLPKLEQIKKNSLRNPIVEKIVNQVINVVNAIIEDPTLGRPDEIRIELARHLKDNADKRRKAEERNRKAEKEYKEYENRLRELFPNFKRISRKDIEKYRLWLEFEGISPYEPTKCIDIAQLFNGEYEVEHIIPKARLFDDSFTNKTLARREINQKKGDLTAFDFMASLSEQDLHNYKEFISKSNVSYLKKQRLLMTESQIPEDFIERQLRETQYITKTVKELLSKVCREVTTTTGGITDYLRKDWGLDEVLQDLNWHKYEAANQTEEYEIEQTNGKKHRVRKINGWSKRDDHRNHAIDALVVACTKQGHVQQLNNLNQLYNSQRELKESGRKFKKPHENLTALTKKAVENILISYKSGKKVATFKKNKKTGDVTLVPRGPLHEETVYGKLNDRYTVRYELGINFDKVDSIIDEQVRKLVKQRFENAGNDPRKAFKDLENNPIWWNKEQGIKIVRVKCWANLKNADTLRVNENNEPIAFVKSGNNHHVAIYEDEKGKRYEEVVSLWEATERIKQKLPVINRNHEKSYRFIVSMQINEFFVFNMTKDDLKTAIATNNYKAISPNLYRVQSLSTNDYFFRNHTESNNEKDNLAAVLRKFIRIRAIDNMTGIKVKVNHLGKISLAEN